MINKINDAITEQIFIRDSSNNPVTGLVDGNFTKELLKDKSSTVETITISEKGDGYYYIDFTPTDTGLYEWKITHATYEPNGWYEYYQVKNYDTEDIYTVVAENQDLITRALGLAQENFYIDTLTFTGDNLISSRIRLYDVAGSVGTDNDVTDTYDMTSTYDIDGKLTSYKVVKQ